MHSSLPPLPRLDADERFNSLSRSLGRGHPTASKVDLGVEAPQCRPQCRAENCCSQLLEPALVRRSHSAELREPLPTAPGPPPYGHPPRPLVHPTHARQLPDATEQAPRPTGNRHRAQAHSSVPASCPRPIASTQDCLHHHSIPSCCAHHNNLCRRCSQGTDAAKTSVCGVVDDDDDYDDG